MSIKSIYSLWQDSFNDKEPFADYYFSEKTKDNKILLIEENDVLISMLHLNPYTLHIDDSTINSDYIVGVATHKGYRGKGYMRQILNRAIRDMYNSGNIFTFLMPADEKIYTGFGFGFIDRHYSISATAKPINSIKPFPKKDLIDIKIITEKNYNELIDLYSSIMQDNFNLYIKRDFNYFVRLQKELASENGHIVGFYRDGILEGYIMLYNLDDSIEIREIIYRDRALVNMIEFLYNKFSEKKINISTYCDDILSKSIHYYFDIHNVIKPFIMGRILDVKKFIKHIKGCNVKFNIEIIDDIIEDNNNVFSCDINDIESMLVETSGEADISIDIGLLTQWWLGYVDIDMLYKLDLVKCRDYKIIEMLRGIQTTKKVFINEIV